MKNTGINKRKMYIAVNAVFASHGTAWSSIPACEIAHTLFEAKLGVLTQLLYEQNAATLGVKDEKDKERKATVKRAKKLILALRIYAADSDDMLLRGKVKFPLSDLVYRGTVRTMQLLSQINEMAITHGADIIPHGVTQQEIDEFTQMYLNMEAVFASTRNAIVNRGLSTDQIETQIREIDALLKDQLDKYAELLRDDYPEFAISYKIARGIVDLPGKKNKKNGPEDPQDDFPVTK